MSSSADGLKLVAADGLGRLGTSINAGVTWTVRETVRDWWAVASSADGTRLVAAVLGGQLYTSSDSGVTWAPRETDRLWISVASSADGLKLFAAELDGLLFTSADGGATWTPHEAARSWLAVASSADGSKLIAGASGDQLYCSEPAFAGAQGSHVALYYLGSGQWAPVAETQLAAGSVKSAQIAPGTVLSSQSVPASAQDVVPNTRYTATSASPTTFTLPTTANVGDIVEVSGTGTGGWSVDTPDGLSVPGAPVVLVPRENARNWQAVASSTDGSRLLAADAGDSQPGGRLYISANSGATWTSRDHNRRWVSVAVGAYLLVATTQGGELYVSQDFGGTWTQKHVFPASRTSVACSALGYEIIAAGYGGQLWTSPNGGSTWTPRETYRNWQSVASSADGAKLIAAEQGGRLYTSTDAGVTWTPRESSRNWASVASSADGLKLVAAGGENGGLYFSNDAGLSWLHGGPVSHYTSVACSWDGLRLIAAEEIGHLYCSQSNLAGTQGSKVTLQYFGEGQWGQTSPIVSGPVGIADLAGDISESLWTRDGTNIYRPSGRVGIGKVPDPIGVNNGPLVLQIEGNASKTTGGSWMSSSDRRIKQDIQTIDHAVETLDRVRLVDFRYTDDYRRAHPVIEDKRYLNVIAQEFAEVFPDHVTTGGETLPDGSHILQVDTYPLTIYSAAAIQELHRTTQALQQENAELKQRLDVLEEIVRAFAK